MTIALLCFGKKIKSLERLFLIFGIKSKYSLVLKISITNRRANRWLLHVYIVKPNSEVA